LGFSGASGMAYGLRVLEILLRQPDLEVHWIPTKAATLVLKNETGIDLNLERWEPQKLGVPNAEKIIFHHPENLMAPPASGSFNFSAVVVVPCSMGFIGAVASGLGRDLLERAVDVALKEKRPLILAPRETPFSSIHLENMLKLSRAGVVIMPAAPGFYGKPKRVEDLVDFMAGRILDHLRIEHDLGPRWGSDNREAHA
jgi:4-hydroxy-3-polyprenylbenzoate decarboxylase